MVAPGGTGSVFLAFLLAQTGFIFVNYQLVGQPVPSSSPSLPAASFLKPSAGCPEAAAPVVQGYSWAYVAAASFVAAVVGTLLAALAIGLHGSLQLGLWPFATGAAVAVASTGSFRLKRGTRDEGGAEGCSDEREEDLVPLCW